MTAPPIRPADRAALELLHSLCGSGPVAYAEWRAALINQSGNRDSGRRVFNRAFKALEAAGRIVRDGEFVRVTNPLPTQCVVPSPCPVAHLPEGDRHAARKLLTEHDRLAAKLDRVGPARELWQRSEQNTVAAQLFHARIKLSRVGIAVPPLSLSAHQTFKAFLIPTFEPQAGGA